MSCSSSLSPLGNFRKLPPETRLNIWRFLMPLSVPPPPPSVPPPRPKRQSGFREVDSSDIDERPKSRLSILRTSRDLYEEVSSELYRRELCFYICVGRLGFSIKHYHGLLSYYRRTPLHKFRNVAIELEAPAESIDMALLSDGMRSVMSVLEFMIVENLIGPVFLHQIDIRFVNGAAGTTWSRPGAWKGPIPESLILSSDYFLGPFRLLDILGKLKIHVPEGFENHRFVTHCIRDVMTSMWPLPYDLGNYKSRRLQREFNILQEEFSQTPCRGSR